MNILVIGQCTLQWGRMEFGNIGNYYIIEPFFRELHRTFPSSQIQTTMQMSQRFCQEEDIFVLPMDLYYGWRDEELELAKAELCQSEKWKITGKLAQSTPYLDAVMWADFVIDFSGDMWGDNANLVGPDRFEVGMIKDLIAQNLKKRVFMLAGSPGPFSSPRTKNLARHVYANFDLVINREPISTQLLAEQGFDMSRTATLACPAFLFEPASGPSINGLLQLEGLVQSKRSKPIVGFILCGWNFEIGPFDRWPREDCEYIKFIENIEYLTEELGVQVCLMSHSNGFDIPPASFRLKHGRDYQVIKQLQKILLKRGISNSFFTLDRVYDAWETKAIIGTFDMLVSGRIHAAVAGLSQFVPTVVIDYGHAPKAHKLLGFLTVTDMVEYIADAFKGDDMKIKIAQCWNNRTEIRRKLSMHMPKVQELARQNFSRLRCLV